MYWQWTSDDFRPYWAMWDNLLQYWWEWNPCVFFFLIAGQKWLRNRYFCMQIHSMWSFYELDRDFYELDRLFTHWTSLFKNCTGLFTSWTGLRMAKSYFILKEMEEELATLSTDEQFWLIREMNDELVTQRMEQETYLIKMINYELATIHILN